VKHDAIKQSTSKLLHLIPNLINHQACGFILGKIRMCLTDSSEPVAMKHRAMEPINKMKILFVHKAQH
jgi:hypothetical protein